MTEATEYTFTIGDHNEQMHEYIGALIDEAYRRKEGEGAIPEPTTPQERVYKADKLCEDYYAQVGAKPSSGALSRLAWYVIFDDMTDSHPDKMTRTEYPIMSYGQTGRYFARNGKLKEVPYDHEEVIGYMSHLNDDGEGERTALLNPETSVQRAINWRLFIREVLTEREALIIERTYEDGATQAEIAKEIGVSQPRVAQITRDIYDKLRGIIDDIML